MPEPTVTMHLEGKEPREVPASEMERFEAIAKKHGLGIRFSMERDGGQMELDPSVGVPRDVSKAEAFGRGFIDSATFGLDNLSAYIAARLGGGAPQAARRGTGNTELLPESETAARAVDSSWAQDEHEAREDEAGAFMGGQVAGGIMSALPFAPAGAGVAAGRGSLATGASLANRVGTGMLLGGAYGAGEGAVRGAGESAAQGNEAGRVLLDTAGGAAVGGGMGLATGGVAPLVGHGISLARKKLHQGAQKLLDQSMEGEGTSVLATGGLRETPMGKELARADEAAGRATVADDYGAVVQSAEPASSRMAARLAKAAMHAQDKWWSGKKSVMNAESDKFFATPEGRKRVKTDSLLEWVNDEIAKYSGRDGAKAPSWFRLKELEEFRDAISRPVGDRRTAAELRAESDSITRALDDWGEPPPEWVQRELESAATDYRKMADESVFEAIPMSARDLDKHMRRIDKMAATAEAADDHLTHARRMSQKMHEFRANNWGPEWAEIKRRHFDVLQENAQRELALGLRKSKSLDAKAVEASGAAIAISGMSEARQKAMISLMREMDTEAIPGLDTGKMLELAELPADQQPKWFQDTLSVLDRPVTLGGIRSRPRPAAFEDLYRQTVGQSSYEQLADKHDVAREAADYFGAGMFTANRAGMLRSLGNRLDPIGRVLQKSTLGGRSYVMIPGMTTPLVRPDGASPADRLNAAAARLPDQARDFLGAAKKKEEQDQ